MTKDEALDFKCTVVDDQHPNGIPLEQWGRPAPVQEPVYHLRQFGDVTKAQLDRYMATGDINPQPAPVQEPVAWKNAAIRLGEELSSVGPDGYYDMTAEQWLDWAMDQRPRGKNSLPAAQRQWVGLTDEEIGKACGFAEYTTDSTRFALKAISRAIEAKLKEKNNG
jgi:hypothetical protein